MKIHSLGNDYAHQRKQKQMEAQSVTVTESEPSVNKTTETHAGDQIQTGGEGETLAAAEENSSQKKSKKKKEAGTEIEQSKDESPVS